MAGRRASVSDAFQFKINTNLTSAGSSNTFGMILPFETATPVAPLVDMTVDWGDGTTTVINSSNYVTARSHVYSVAGVYAISITGEIRGWSFLDMDQAGASDSRKVTSITNWGNFEFRETGSFFDCRNLTDIVCGDIPKWYSGSTFNAFLLNQSLTTINRLGEWDMSSQSNMRGMFSGCNVLEFDPSVSGGKIDVSNWDVSNTALMDFMFANCRRMNSKMFQVTSTTTDIKGMFQGCTVFDAAGTTSMDSWDVSSVGSMERTFMSALAFNRNISGWTTTNLNNLTQTFAGNPSLSPANEMAFNQNIGLWDTKLVTSFNGIFVNCSSFDQDLSNWDLQAVSTIGTAGGGTQPMCYNVVSAFHVPLTLSTANYDAALIAWDTGSYPSIPSGIWAFGLSKFSASPSAAASARASLITKWGGISDGGPI